MSPSKVKCVACGAKNSDALAERCRICSSLLPDAVRRRKEKLEATTAGPTFSVIAETEVAAWNDYAARRNAPGPKSRRPPVEPEPALEDGDGASRWRWRRRKGSDTVEDSSGPPT